MIIASFPDDYTPTVTVKDEVWQYDYGQVLQVEGLTVDDVTELDFATSTTATYAKVLAAAKVSDKVMQVTIPDDFLINSGKKQDYNLYVWVFVVDGESGETTHRITIPIKSRPPREDFSGDPSTESNPFDSAIIAVNNAAGAASTAAENAAASEAAAQDILDAIEKAIVGVASLSVEKVDGVTTITATTTSGDTQVVTIEDGKFVGHSYDAASKTLTLFEED